MDDKEQRKLKEDAITNDLKLIFESDPSLIDTI